MFQAGDEVRITSCEDDPRAAGRTGRIVDEVPPGPLTGGRWTVAGIGLLIGPVLCTTAELCKTATADRLPHPATRRNRHAPLPRRPH